MTDIEQDAPTDPVALARLFVAGRSIKRGETIQMVRALLMLLDSPEYRDMPAAIYKEETVCDDDLKIFGSVSGVPSVVGYDARPPIAVQLGVAGSIFLGPEANRYFTREEAIALAGAIARAATQPH